MTTILEFKEIENILVKRDPLALIFTEKKLPAFEILTNVQMSGDDQIYPYAVKFDGITNPYCQSLESAKAALLEKQLSFINHNCFGYMRAETLSEKLNKSFNHEYDFYTTYDMGNLKEKGNGIQLLCSHFDTEGNESSAWIIISEEKVALRYLTNIGFSLEDVKKIVSIISSFTKSEFSITYSDKEIFQFSNGVEN